MLIDPNRMPGPENAGLRARGPFSPFVRNAVLLVVLVGVVTAILLAIFGD